MIPVRPLTPISFAPYGDVIAVDGAPDMIINQGKCGRYHDIATLAFDDARAGVSIFKADCRALPYAVDLVERHPLGSQCFVPMTDDPFLVIVAPDAGGTPATPVAFITNGQQAINFHKNTWHGVLTPLSGSGLFAVIDRIGDGNNLEEHWFEEPYLITRE